MEKWKKVEGFNERYSVSTFGRVRNDERNSLLKPMLSTSGYNYVHLVMNRKKYTSYIHRLVGTAFLENPENLPQIDHINGNKTNNNIKNLRWVTVTENHLAYGREQRAKSRKRAVIARNANGKSMIFDSRKELADFFDCSPTKVEYGRIYKKGSKKGWSFQQIS